MVSPEITPDGDRINSVKEAELLDYVSTSLVEEETFHFLSFEFLQRLNIVRIQNDLIDMRENILRTRGHGYEKEKLSRLLDEYSKTLLDQNCDNRYAN